MCCSNENAFDRRYITILVKTDVMESKFKQFYHYQQNEQWPYSLNTKKKKSRHMTMDIQVLTWEGTNICRMKLVNGSQAFPLENHIHFDKKKTSQK